VKTKSTKVFYGWWIVGALLLISAYSAGTMYYGFTAFFEPIARQFNWSYAQVSFSSSIQGLGMVLLYPVVGFLIDRWGPRKLIFSGAIFCGLGALAISRVNSLLTFYAASILISIGMSTTGGLLPMAVVGSWFRKNVSIATGIVTCGTGLGGLLVNAVSWVIDKYGWRTAMTIIGIGAVIIMLPLSLLVRHKPEQYGDLPDGEKNGTGLKYDLFLEQPAKANIGAGHALKNPVFWHISLGFLCHGLAISAVLTHVMPYLSSVDIPRSTASLIASLIPFASIMGRLSFGWFGDKYDRRRITAIGFAMAASGLLFFAFVSEVRTWLLGPFIILFGLGFGGPIPMNSTLILQYFGRARFGTIIGMSMAILGIGNVLGPPLAGWVFDSFGSYFGAWFIFIGILLAGMISFLTTPAEDKAKAGGLLGR
jgi:MFS family permease